MDFSFHVYPLVRNDLVVWINDVVHIEGLFVYSRVFELITRVEIVVLCKDREMMDENTHAGHESVFSNSYR